MGRCTPTFSSRCQPAWSSLRHVAIAKAPHSSVVQMPRETEAGVGPSRACVFSLLESALGTPMCPRVSPVVSLTLSPVLSGWPCLGEIGKRISFMRFFVSYRLLCTLVFFTRLPESERITSLGHLQPRLGFEGVSLSHTL